jgi:hypothetical protein
MDNFKRQSDMPCTDNNNHNPYDEEKHANVSTAAPPGSHEKSLYRTSSSSASPLDPRGARRLIRETKVNESQEKPHSGPTITSVSKPHVEPSLESFDLQQNEHNARTAADDSVQRTKKPPINYPPASSRLWKDVEGILGDVLPTIFPREKIASWSSQQLIHNYNEWLYEFFSDKFKLKEERTSKTIHKPRINPAMLRARRAKTKLRQVYRQMIQRYGKDHPAVLAIQKSYLKLVRKHNRLRVALALKTRAKAKAHSEKQFRADPNAYAKKLFAGSKQSGKPTFSKEEAEEYFRKTYEDSGRGYKYEPMPGMSRPKLPEFDFDIKPPTLADLTRIVSRKRNKATPGFNNLGYVPYKKCPSILKILLQIYLKIWKERKVPEEWAIAYLILLSKSEILHKVGEFRPIALTNCDGKVFFSLISGRTENYLVNNKYINRSKQKGFLSEMSGCIEHSFALHEALREAKEEQKQIVTTWIDLANAYGSVRHNLIQFALNWYHVPKFIQDLIFDYYEKLGAQVVTEDWATGFFRFDTGLFQGCVLSAILFDAVFNLLIDFLAPLDIKGFKFKNVDIQGLTKAYADDLTITTQTPKGNQEALNKTVEWLDWTVTMKAKPSKCVHLAMKRFDKRLKSNTYVPYGDTQYSPFNANLTIDGEPVHFIANDAITDEFKKRHFKFLGRNEEVNLSDKMIRAKAKSDLLSYMDLVDKDPVNGLMKLWLYQFYVTSKVQWPLMIYDFARSFVVKLEKNANVSLRRWAGLYRSTDDGSLYRSQARFGLGLTSLSALFERLQVTKCHLLKHSKDDDVRTLYLQKAKQEENISVWRGSKHLTKCQAIADHDLKFQGQTHRQGLGNGNYNQDPTIPEQRKLVTEASNRLHEEAAVVKSYGLEQQGVWTQFYDHAIPFDLSWKNLIWGKHDNTLIKFVLNATIDMLRTPTLLKLWYNIDATCTLCDHPRCSQHHILSNCKAALQGKRYTWRHDSVLNTLQPHLQRLIERYNAIKEAQLQLSLSIPPLKQSFISEGEPAPSKPAPKSEKSLLSGSKDWRLLIDFDKTMVIFPPEITTTNLRPDVIIWSLSSRTVILGELTCPSEEGIKEARIRKLAKYQELVRQIQAERPRWTVHLHTFEVGVRGFVAFSLRKFLRSLGMSPSHTRSAVCAASRVVARCSHYIFLSHRNRAWHKPTLLEEEALEANE